ncbi:hydroxypyruvate isomerase [Muriicola jejuensis]|uniref:TIM barrel protein n=1 Tax=Muriicola jejuensis TaxID=504488 RepID=A0A6P0U6U8_9FLAO|nr:TIM barrel protein [Muriicola jejuensis]NER09001.1 TIM barrel protein [Muriicola jejuensis]SMP12276.1 hydroxypyruvate isomerase [Muriicola jejuensis]
MKRRTFITSAATASAGIMATPPLWSGTDNSAPYQELKGNINHSACYWCYGSIPLERFLADLNSLGVKAIDLVGPEDWPLLKKYGIHASMCWGAEINLTDGWCDPQFHSQLIENYSAMIPKVAQAGYTNLICFSGSRRGMDDEEGLQHAATGLKQVLSLAERHGVILQMELLNSKIDHKDYMCDHTSWGVALCDALGSDHFKLLYDIYHMQIMEGDVIRTLETHHEYIGHYHTGGNPGRHEIDETQELFYPAIMKSIVKTGFKGYVAQEFIPSWEDKIAALNQGVRICDV